MAQTTTTKRINLYQLGQAMSGADLRMVGTGDSTTSKTIKSSVAQAALDAAVAAHVADFSIVAPRSTSEINQQTVAAALAQALTDLQAILDSPDPAAGTLTAAQLSTTVRQLATAVKTLALVEKRAIRYVTGDFTATA